MGFKILFFITDKTGNHYESFLLLNIIPLSLYLDAYLLGEGGRAHENFIPELNPQ